jgi:hypothetical protein
MADGLLGGIGDFFLGGGRYADPTAINPQYGVPESDVRQAGINTLANVSALLLAAGQPMSGAQRAQLLSGIGPALGGMQRDIQQSVSARRAGELFPLQRRQLQQSISGQELQQQLLQQQIAQQQAERESRQRMVQQLFGGTPVPPPPVVGGAAAPSGMPAMPPSAAPAAGQLAATPAVPAAPGVPGLPAGSVLSSLPPDVLRTLLSDPSVKVSDIYKKAMEAQSSSEKETFDRATKIRSEFDKVATPFNDRQTAYRTMIDLAQNKQGASDMSLVLSIMKIYDPTSTVTGGEAANAQNAAGVPSFIVGYYNRLVGGGILSDTARNELVRAGETRFEQEMDKFEGDLTRYTGLATRNKVAVEDVVTDFRDPELKQARQMKKDFDLAARRLTVDEVTQLPADILGKLNPSLMSRSVADAYKKRVDELTRVGVAPAAPARAQPALPELSYGPGQNPLGRAMQQYPGGLLRSPQLPTPQF